MQFPVPAAATRRVASLHRSRTHRAARRRLCAELDTYRTPTEQVELDAVFRRHTPAQLDALGQLTGPRSRAA